MPVRLVVSAKTVAEGTIEVKPRKAGSSQQVAPDQILQTLANTK